MARTKLSPESLWLLCYLNEQHPIGVASTVALPVPSYLKREVKLCQVRGLIRRGWAEEKHRGIFYITQRGKEAITRMLTSYRGNEIWRQRRTLGTVHG